MALKLTSTAPTAVTQEIMKMMMTKTAAIAKKVNKEEVMMTKQCLIKLCSIHTKR